MDLSSEHDAELGEDLATLVRALPASLAQVTPLSRRGPAHRATAFHLRFADTSVCKGVLLETTQQAEEVATVARALSHCGIPAVLDQRGPALLTQWIDGASLDHVDCSTEMMRRCGALHGLAHTASIATAQQGQPTDILRRRRRNLHRDLDALVESGLIDRTRAQQVDEIAARLAPASCTMGHILGDFCAENIVRTVSGQLFVVDIETLAIDACEYDLARTWYRWPLNPPERAAYWEGYRAHLDPAAFVAHLPFWAILALVDGTIFRSRYRPTTTSVPLARLCHLVEQIERGLAPADAMAL